MPGWMAGNVAAGGWFRRGAVWYAGDKTRVDKDIPGAVVKW